MKVDHWSEPLPLELPTLHYGNERREVLMRHGCGWCDETGREPDELVEKGLVARGTRCRCCRGFRFWTRLELREFTERGGVVAVWALGTWKLGGLG